MATRTTRAIVVGTDFSPSARNAVARAIDLARARRAVVHVVHASPRIPRAVLSAFAGLDEQKIRRALGGVVDHVREAGVTAHPHYVQGSAVSALTRQAREVRAELVVVGARGRTVPDGIIGSTAERVVATSGLRVLLTRRPASVRYREVVIAADESSRLGDQVAAAKLFASEPPSILHVYEDPFETPLRLQGAGLSALAYYRKIARIEAEARLEKLIDSEGLDRRHLVLRHGSPICVLGRMNRDTLLVLSRGRSTVRHLLLGSVTRVVAGQGTSDVLLV